jgi:hypothetical protein
MRMSSIRVLLLLLAGRRREMRQRLRVLGFWPLLEHLMAHGCFWAGV